MAFAKIIASLLLIMASMATPILAKEYKVGDDDGWTAGVDYNAWAAKYTFRQGDTLRFVFQGDNNVEQVSEEEFLQCKDSPNPIVYGNIVNLNDVGMHYFICSFPNKCQSGMKLQIRVVPASEDQTPAAPFFPSPIMPRSSDVSPLALSLYTHVLLIFASCCLSLYFY